MSTNRQKQSKQRGEFDLSANVKAILQTIKSPRNREIIRRRLGLFDRRQTLDEIGKSQDLTRERIRQLEKSVMAELEANVARSGSSELKQAETHIRSALMRIGNVARVSDLAKQLVGDAQDRIHQAQITFLARLSPEFVVIEPSHHHHPGIALRDHHNAGEVHQHISSIVDHIDDLGSPVSAGTISQNRLSKLSPDHVHGLASLSKRLSFLDGVWGMHHWQSVNPSNIAAKIDIILRKHPEPLHFLEIADKIRNSNFRRNSVTPQAVHNELIKGDDFVLVGRGLYAHRDRGYQPGTVADIITAVLKEADGPVERSEIVRQVLRQRLVKETTISLNLQSKPQFKRQPGTGKYILDPSFDAGKKSKK